MRRNFSYILLLILMSLSGQIVSAQGIYLSKWIPGNYGPVNSSHRVEIYNPTGSTVNLSGYLMATRNYSVIFPNGTSLRSYSSLVIGLKSTGAGRVDIDLGTTPDFLVNFPDADFGGNNYLILYDKKRKVKDAVYFSPVPNVPFLPEDRQLFTFSGEVVKFRVPPENVPVWSHISIGPDPAIAFERINRNWRVTSVNRNLSPATDYRSINLRYQEGIVTVKWSTTFEEDCDFHIVERSIDRINYEEIGRVPAAGNSFDFQQYVFYDKGVEEGKQYFYRISNIDKFRHKILSNNSEITTKDVVKEFSWDIYFGKPDQKELNVRFLSQYSTRVRIKIVDDRYREVAVIFNDYIYAETQNLLKITEPLSAGDYLVIFDTENQRYFKEITVAE